MKPENNPIFARDSIMITIGVADEVNGEPMTFVMVPEWGIKFENSDYTFGDMRIAAAVLRDLADALDFKMSQMNN